MAVFLMAAMFILVFVLFIIEEPVGSDHRLKPKYIVGTLARAIDPVDERSGVVTVLGEDWPARSIDRIPADSRVRILSVAQTETNVYLIVEPLASVPKAHTFRSPSHLARERQSA